MSYFVLVLYTIYTLFTSSTHYIQAARLSTLSRCHKLIQESTPPYTLSEAETRIHTKNRPQSRFTMDSSTNQHQDYNTRQALKTQTILQQRANTLATYPTPVGHNSDPHPEHPETTSDNDENEGPNHATSADKNNNKNTNNNNNNNMNTSSPPHPSSSHVHIYKDPSVRSLQDLHRHPSHMSWLVYAYIVRICIHYSYAHHTYALMQLYIQCICVHPNNLICTRLYTYTYMNT